MNFCVNRTTAERFSRTSKAKTKKAVDYTEDESEVKAGEGKIDLKASENIVKLYDEIPDFSSKSFARAVGEANHLYRGFVPWKTKLKDINDHISPSALCKAIGHFLSDNCCM